MDFYEPTTCYNEFNKACKDKNRLDLRFSDPIAFYDENIDGLLTHGTEYLPYINATIGELGADVLTFRTERRWYAAGRPYYKIWPDMAAAMAETSIEIPFGVLRLPYPSFAVRLPMGFELVPGQPAVRAIMLSCEPVKNKGGDYIILRDPAEADSVGLHMLYAFDRYDEEGTQLQFHYTLNMRDPNATIESQFAGTYTTHPPNANAPAADYNPPREVTEAIIKLAVATCFFGIDKHELVMPDLSRKKLEKLRRRGKQAEADYNDHPDRDNEANWTIGREVSLPRPLVGCVDEHGDGDEKAKRSLHHGYIRRGHMRWQVCGEGRRDRRLLFVPPHVCRPDLPIKQHGYKITGE